LELVGSNELDWAPKLVIPGLTPKAIFFGQGNAAQAMQIATASANSTPSRSQLKSLYAERKGKLPISLMIAVEHDDQVSIFGPDPDSETLTLRAGNAINFLNAVLSEPEESLSYQKAISIRRSLQTTNILGFTNNGLFASHYIRTSGPAHPSWNKCLEDSKNLVDLRNKQLIEGLGFEITSSPANTHVLRAKGQDKRVVAVLLDQNESFDGKSARFQTSPVEWGLNMASNEGAPWLIAIRDSQIRLYPAKDGVGVGQKSQVETYFEIDLLTIDEEKSAFLPLVFSAEALSEGGTADELLRESKKFAAALGTRLRERVYESIVPQLATEIANQLRDKGHKLDTEGLQLAYGLTLRVLFRLLFQAYAEDRGLLPAGRNERFDKNSLKDRAADLIKHGPDFEFGDASSIWLDCMQIWNAIDQGSPEMQIPAYNGGLFGTDETLHPEGFHIGSMRVPDRVMGPALRALVIDDTTEDGVPGMVDFRSLSVREFGTIYEGLLESSLSVAEQDLTVDKKGAWVPAAKGETVLAKAGEVYFHSASGERKATGSYYTPSFVVDHLIERSVEPALKNHLAKVKEKIVAGDQAAAYDFFFDFRVADLAMGSGHFLVAAIDKIETVMRAFLLEPGNQIEGVEAELKRLEEAAKNALGVDEAAYAEIERASLLRRQIARRCIYGLDINPLAVELSRLAIWIHTFVPGLPMSSLEHGLVCGNSLTGISTLEECVDALLPSKAKKGTPRVADLLEWAVEDSLNQAKTLLLDSANADEATKAEVKKAQENATKAKQSSAHVKTILDVALGNRNQIVDAGEKVTESDLLTLGDSANLIEFLNATNPAHMPFLFPEVFVRENPGFDVLVGNPPWEELMIEEPKFWLRVRPGILGLSSGQLKAEVALLRKTYPKLYEEFLQQKENLAFVRKILLTGPFPGLGIGDVDLYLAFAWKFVNLKRQGGFVGLVLPRSILSSAGGSDWRREVLSSNPASITLLKNKGKWVFESVSDQYTVIALVIGDGNAGSLRVRGPFTDQPTFSSSVESYVELTGRLLDEVHDGGELPELSSEMDLEIIEVLSDHPSLSELGIRPVSEFHATNDRKSFDAGETSFDPKRNMPVIGGKGMNLWKSLTGEYYAIADKTVALPALKARMENQIKLSSSAFFGLFQNGVSEATLSVHSPRLVFRDVARASDPRTAIFSIVPPGVLLTNKAPYLLVPEQSPEKLFFLLGVLSSRVFDWQIKRFVELGLSFNILSKAKIPKYSDSDEIHLSISILAKQLSQDSNAFDPLSKLEELPTSSSSSIPSSEALDQLDLLVAKAFGLSQTQLKVIASSVAHPYGVASNL
jgi:hypothetical protein